VSQRNTTKVADVMSTEFLLIDGLATVAEALALMQPVNAHSILIKKRSADDELGIVLVSDIAKQVLAVNRSPERTNVYEVMSKPVLSVRPEMLIRNCARLFDHFGISTAPVVKDGEVVGVVAYDALVLKGLVAGSH
jgi:predicted transcriptional regulator